MGYKVDFLLDQTNLILLFVAVASGIMLLLPSIGRGSTKKVTVSQAIQMANQQHGIFLDARSADAFKTGTIPQARNVPAADVPAKLGALPKDKPIIVFCDSGREATRVADALRKEGYAQAVSLEGGLKEWAQAGMPLSRKQ